MFHNVFLPLESSSKVTTPLFKNRLVELTAEANSPPGLFRRSITNPLDPSFLIVSFIISDNSEGVFSVY